MSDLMVDGLAQPLLWAIVISFLALVRPIFAQAANGSKAGIHPFCYDWALGKCERHSRRYRPEIAIYAVLTISFTNSSVSVIGVK